MNEAEVEQQQKQKRKVNKAETEQQQKQKRKVNEAEVERQNYFRRMDWIGWDGIGWYVVLLHICNHFAEKAKTRYSKKNT